jgi:hypothetical protein
MADKQNTPEEIEFILDACRVMQDLNDQIKLISGENARSRAVDANIKKLLESIGKQLN